MVIAWCCHVLHCRPHWGLSYLLQALTVKQKHVLYLHTQLAQFTCRQLSKQLFRLCWSVFESRPHLSPAVLSAGTSISTRPTNVSKIFTCTLIMSDSSCATRCKRASSPAGGKLGMLLKSCAVASAAKTICVSFEGAAHRVSDSPRV